MIISAVTWRARVTRKIHVYVTCTRVSRLAWRRRCLVCSVRYARTNIQYRFETWEHITRFVQDDRGATVETLLRVAGVFPFSKISRSLSVLYVCVCVFFFTSRISLESKKKETRDVIYQSGERTFPRNCPVYRTVEKTI